MNKKVWVGVYAASVALLVLTLIIGGFLLLLQVDQVVKLGPNFIIGLAIFAALMYMQFAVVQTIYIFLLLGKMWGSIQDGVTPISVGKAIGFLFIPVFSVYWIFVAWGSFPRHYNEYIERYKLNAPNLSDGVYTILPILMLVGGILVFPIIALPIVFGYVIARTCDAVNNLKQATEDRRNGIARPSWQEQQQLETPKSKRVPMAIGGLAAAAVLFCAGFIGFAVYNLKPKVTANEIPETIGKFKKTYSNARGSIFGLRSEYSATYKPADNPKATDSLDYRMTDYSRESDAVERLKYSEYCSSKNEKKEGALKDKSGAQIGEYMLCGSDYFNFRAKKKFISVSRGYSSISADDMLQFFADLPYNADVNSAEIGAVLKSIPLTTKTVSSSKTGDPKSPVASAAKADFTLTAEDFYKETDGANAAKSKAKFAGKIVEISGRFYAAYGSDTASLHAGKSPISLKIAPESQSKIAGLKADERTVFKCAGDDKSFRAELVSCILTETKGIITPDETPEFTFTAKDYFKEVDGGKSYEIKSKKQAFYAGKVIELSGEIKIIGDKKHYLTVADMEWVDCKPDAGNAAQFAAFTEGQAVKLKGIGSRYGASLEHCLVVSQ